MLDFTPLSPQIGVLVSGLDLDKQISDRDATELNEALKRHRILLFRQGPITAQQQIGLMSALGNVIAEAPGSDALFQWVSTDPNQYVGGTYRLLWHSDGQFTRTGALQAISLNAIEMDRDEPTIFSNQVRAARALPPELRERIEGLELLQCLDLSDNQERTRCRLSAKPASVPMAQFPCATHPLLGRHPFTGEEMLNLSQLFTSHIVGKSDEESDAIFAELEPFQYAPSALYYHHWRVNDLLVWDNIALQHSRDAVTEPSGRRLRRVAINPVGNKELMAGIKPAASRKIGAETGW